MPGESSVESVMIFVLHLHNWWLTCVYSYVYIFVVVFTSYMKMFYKLLLKRCLYVRCVKPRNWAESIHCSVCSLLIHAVFILFTYTIIYKQCIYYLCSSERSSCVKIIVLFCVNGIFMNVAKVFTDIGIVFPSCFVHKLACG